MSLLNDERNTAGFWRSLDALADKPAFRDWMPREFPVAASELSDNFSRRRWLQLMGASLALGGIAGCRWEAEEFAPFTVRPQNRTPGEKQQFSTMWELAGVARPLTVTSVDGRPIKIEGNREHPASRGASGAFDQALILSMYDPDRSTGLVERVRKELVPRTWGEFDRVLDERLQAHARTSGLGLAVVCEVSSSPTQQRLLQTFRNEFPEALVCEVDVSWNHSCDSAVHTVLGHAARLRLRPENARVIACFDADLFGHHPDSLRLIRDWSDRRDPDADWMNRLYCFESSLSLTGSNADHRVPVQSSSMVDVLQRLEVALEAAGHAPPPAKAASKIDRAIAALANDLVRHRGESILVAGPQQPSGVHDIVLRLNHRLENLGSTMDVVPVADTDSIKMAELLTEMASDRVETLVVLDANPAYGTARAASFREAISRVPLTIHAGVFRDETAELCRWHVPVAHALESWSDGRAFDGTITLGQPLIDPLFGGRSPNELLARLIGSDTKARELVRATLVSADQRFRDEKQWRRAVHDGFVKGTALTASDAATELSPTTPPTRATDAGTGRREKIEVVFGDSCATFDGRFANNGWLQETPDPISKLTWDNAALMSPATATRFRVTHGDVVRIGVGETSVELPVFELPGIAEDSVQLTLGYGRTAAGHVGGSLVEGVAPVGVDVSVLLPEDGARILTNARITRTGDRRELATTQDHFAIDTVGLEAIGARIGELVRTGTLAEYQHDADFAQHRGPHHPPLESLWESRSYDGHAWGMSIDLNRCIGCNACMVACQSENNVPIVGKEQVLAGREMHWMRMDRYFAGRPEDPEVAHQPVACHHCENAPCEQVCPVAATVHSDEGLNDMVYNRCIGTRYCANNCPYKVRRFNFLDYNAPLEERGRELVQLAINPDVTVRSRGVMEKCTYCVQRIQDTKIRAGNERRAIADGEVQTACQSACPAQAIVFGDLNDPESAVAAAHADVRAYGMLAELNIKPRTRYLARIRNPHPWLDTDGQSAAKEGANAQSGSGGAHSASTPGGSAHANDLGQVSRGGH